MSRKLTTPAGRRRLEARLAAAEAEYARVCASNPEAAEAGDSSVWHDNFAYEENQRLMHQWSRRVRDLRATLAELELTTTPKAPEAVAVGCAIVVADTTTGRQQRYILAGWDDGDLSARRLAYNSPLGGALIGARLGEAREVRTPAGSRELEIISIENDEEAP